MSISTDIRSVLVHFFEFQDFLERRADFMKCYTVGPQNSRHRLSRVYAQLNLRALPDEFSIGI
jgi:hypothetical protein